MGKKRNRDAKPAEKMLSLYSLLLFSRYELSLSELARILNCSKQTVGRLVDQLESSVYGKVLRTRRGREALYSLDRPKELPRLADGSLLLELESRSWTELLSWVLSFGDSAEVISPEWFRAEMAEQGKNLARIYESGDCAIMIHSL